jgi:diacylglycerol kinase family enzyme
VGLDARIAADVSRYKRLPLLHGFNAYAASTVLNLCKGIAEHYVVEIDGETFDGEFTFICACSGRFYGGGFNPVPEADPTDGLMDVLLVDKVSLAQVPGLIGKYKDGKYKQIPHVVRYFRTRELTVHCDREVSVNVDGESILAKDVTFSTGEEKLRFFYPRGLSFAVKDEVKA